MLSRSLPSSLAVNLHKVAFVFLCLTASPLQTKASLLVDRSDPVQNIIKEELSNLNLFYNRKFDVTFSTGEIQVIRSHPTLIEINISKLNGFISRYSNEETRFLIRLILTHEYIHLIQFEKYSVDFFERKYQKRILESQADILAARYAVLVFYKDFRKSDSINLPRFEIEDPQFIKAYEFFFDLGTNTFSLAEHPSRFQRATSIYRGIKYSLLEIKKEHLAIKKRQNILTTSEILKEVSDIKQEEKNINNSQNNDIFQWSFSMAELICHGNPELMINIVRSKMPRFNDKTPAKEKKFGKNFKTSLYFVNNSSLDLIIDFEVRTASYRKDSGITFFDKIDFYQSKYYSQVIKAHGYLDISDIYKTPLPDRKYEIIIPPDSNSLYTIRSPKTKYVAKTNAYKQKLLEDEIKDVNLPGYLELINDAIARRDVSQIIASFGVPTNTMVERYKIKFNGITPGNMSLACYIRYDRRVKPNFYEIALSFATGKDSINLLNVFKLFESRLKEIFNIHPLQNQIVKEIKKQNSGVTVVIERAYFVTESYPHNLIFLSFEQDFESDLSFESDYMVKGKQIEKKGSIFANWGDQTKTYKVYLYIREKLREDDYEKRYYLN